MVIENFTPWSAFAGGALLGVAASLLLILNGRIAGISGILGGLLVPKKGEIAWRALFLTGLVIAGAVAVVASPTAIGQSPRGLVGLAIAGTLVGIGTRLASGCTSGHGVCGLSRLSIRSLSATVTFMAAGVITVALVRLAGGAP